MRLLLIEDEKRIVDLLTAALSGAGFAIDAVATCADGRDALAAVVYDAAILDLGLPDGDGLSLLADLRSGGSKIPVLVLTARDTVEAGDVYLVCSDGLWNEVAADEMRRVVAELAPADACAQLVELGTRRGASDNMTVAIAAVHEVVPAPAAAPRWKSWLGRG